MSLEYEDNVRIYLQEFSFLCFLEREDNFAAWKRAVIKSFERSTVPFNIENKGK